MSLIGVSRLIAASMNTAVFVEEPVSFWMSHSMKYMVGCIHPKGCLALFYVFTSRGHFSLKGGISLSFLICCIITLRFLVVPVVFAFEPVAIVVVESNLVVVGSVVVGAVVVLVVVVFVAVVVLNLRGCGSTLSVFLPPCSSW